MTKSKEQLAQEYADALYKKDTEKLDMLSGEPGIKKAIEYSKYMGSSAENE